MQNDAMKNTTRGGQTLLHNLRMINQVLNKVLLWTLPVGLFVAFAWFMLLTTVDDRALFSQWLWAQFYLLIEGSHHQQLFQMPDGSITRIFSAQIAEAPFVKAAVLAVTETLTRAAWVGFAIYLLTVIGTLIWLQKRGNQQSQNKNLKGDYLADSQTIKKSLIKKDRLSTFMLGKEKLPLPLFAEMQHFLFHGTTGSGKSTGIKEFLDTIRVRGERAIIYDRSCNLVKQFFDEKTDHILNPWDKRTRDWSLWQECRDKADFESLSAALIPMVSTQDPFWVNAARTIFAASSYQMRKEKNPKILPLLRYLLTADIESLQSLLKGTEAESLMSEKTEKTAISIKSVLATYLRSLCFIADGDAPFSIRQWVQNDTEKSWLFISSLGDKHESIKPLITAWLDIAVNALLSLPENPQRRIWVILDELTSLQQLPYLTTALSEARKFGGCFVIGIQSYAQLAKVYGGDGGKEISSLLNTRFMFRVPDPDIAAWSAKNLGETTVEEVREGISYGANTMRDGVSVNRIERNKAVVSFSEIMRLDDLTCYVRLPGDYPLTLLHLPYIARPDKNTAFIPREFKTDGLRGEVLNLAENMANVPATATQANTDRGITKKTRTQKDKAKNKAEIPNKNSPASQNSLPSGPDLVEQLLE